LEEVFAFEGMVQKK
jgi:hypothetical protein